MRIPLFYSDERIKLVGVIRAPRVRKPVTFVIDTGSKDSLLSIKDAIPAQQSSSKEIVGLGGASFDAITIDRMKITLFDEEKRLTVFRLRAKSLRTRRIAEEKRTLAESLPSILGLDFLRINNLSLHIIPNEDIAYLECA